MTNKIPIRRRPHPSEEGYMLVAVMFLMAIMVISLTVAAPIIKKQIQHDRELETMHRGKQYIRAIKMYYKKFGAYPPNVDALVNTNQIRFLRKKYVDPTTGKPDWKLIHIGQNKVPTAWGFFGQPLTGAGASGCGVPGLSGPSTGGIGTSGTSGAYGTSGGSSGGFGSNGFGTSGMGSNGLGGSSTPGCATTGSTDPNSTTNGQATNGQTNNGQINGQIDPNNPNNPPAANGGTIGSGGTTGANGTTTGAAGTGTGLDGQTGQTFGGAGIIGVSPNSPKQSILTLHKKNHYNEWEFVYDPLAEQLMMQGMQGGTGLTGTPAGGANPTNGPGSTPTTNAPSPTPPSSTPPSQ
jgi:type II secretory pathway pseudopilin PulG